MHDDPSKSRLGRGLSSLIGEISEIDRFSSNAPSSSSSDRIVSIELIEPNPQNPRRFFNEDELANLAQSIGEHGLVQPVVVRSASRLGHFEIIAGERRWRAAQRAGLSQVPVIIREVNDRTALELAIIENVQRADLNPIEEATGYQRLIDEHNYTQADLAQIIGKSRSHVANTLRLLKLPDSIQKLLVDGSLSAGHARTLVAADNPQEFAMHILEQGLSVRQAEALSKKDLSTETNLFGSRNLRAKAKDPETMSLEKLLTDITGLKVTIFHADGKGQIRFYYENFKELDDFCFRLQKASLVSSSDSNADSRLSSSTTFSVSSISAVTDPS